MLANLGPGLPIEATRSGIGEAGGIWSVRRERGVGVGVGVDGACAFGVRCLCCFTAFDGAFSLDGIGFGEGELDFLRRFSSRSARREIGVTSSPSEVGG